MPGKGASIAVVDTLETPIVRLKDGSVVRVRDVEHAASLAEQLDSILYLGDILISFGDFLENNHKLVPSAYVEEWWAQEFAQKFKQRYSTLESGARQISGCHGAKIEKILRRSAPRVSQLFGSAKNLPGDADPPASKVPLLLGPNFSRGVNSPPGIPCTLHKTKESSRCAVKPPSNLFWKSWAWSTRVSPRMK